MQIEVEVSNLREVKEAVESGADIIMLDNMNLNDIKRMVTLIRGKALIEASGRVALDSVAEIANSGVDIISIGAVTHSARAVDISMRVVA